MNVVVVAHDVADHREHHRERVQRYLAHAVVRRIGDPHAVPGAGLGVDRVVARANATDDAYLGQRGDSDLPNYLKGCDVALVPFALSEATRFLSPTKTLEYFAARKPVVSTLKRTPCVLFVTAEAGFGG